MPDDNLPNPEEHFKKPESPEEYKPGKLGDAKRYGSLPPAKSYSQETNYQSKQFTDDLAIAMKLSDPIEFMTKMGMFAPEGVGNPRKGE